MSQDDNNQTDASDAPAWMPDEIRAATACVPQQDHGHDQITEQNDPQAKPQSATDFSNNAGAESGTTRRQIMREGARLAFVAPLLSTFLAGQAYAANYSCYPAGHVCGTGLEQESCCNGACLGSPGVCP